MLIEERRRAILESLRTEGRVLVVELAKRFRTSQVTIRKDLEILHAAPGGNGVEARARRPRAISSRSSRATDAEVMQWAD